MNLGGRAECLRRSNARDMSSGNGCGCAGSCRSRGTSFGALAPSCTERPWRRLSDDTALTMRATHLFRRRRPTPPNVWRPIFQRLRSAEEARPADELEGGTAEERFLAV